MEGTEHFGATTYDWRPDVQKYVDHVERRYNTKCNTYVDHPTGWWLDDVSVDHWAPQGRGWAIDKRTGDAIARALRKRSKAPYVRWYIWQGWVHVPGQPRYRYTDPQDMHYDHVHVTFW
jgi:hypothetical protein